ncbi:MAG: glucose-1-phosphate thymidylyltransferase [Chitinophagaceae bacterium]|nr:glucose-1-phosphate thymidylyltransferase [Chitinophagaceae bacterium]
MKILLFDTADRKSLFPITLTRATATIRMGIDTLQDKWERLLNLPSLILTEEYLQVLYEPVPPGEYLLVASNLLPTQIFADEIKQLQSGQSITDKYGLVAGILSCETAPVYGADFGNFFKDVAPATNARRIDMYCNIFNWNAEMIEQDFNHFSKGRLTNGQTPGVTIISPENVFIEEGAQINYSILNASTGPIYIGKNAVIMEGCLIRGPFALGEDSVLKMGTKVYGATTIGPHCVGGGEIKNVVMMGYSNKAHDGYLGDSVIGEWCNLGAGTSNSNLKNNVSEVKVWSYKANNYIASGIKCGIVMGDYSRSSINTSFNTGTVVGVCCNVFGEGPSPKFIPDFTWGAKGLSRYELDIGLKDVTNWMQLKNIKIEDSQIEVLKHIFDHYNQ